MQNKFIRFGFVLVLLILILPFGFSFLAKNIVTERLASGQKHLERIYETSRLSDKFGMTVSLNLADYQRGWLTSSGKIRVKVNTFPQQKTMDIANNTVMPKAMPAIEVNIPITIHHGPIVYIGSKSQGSKVYIGQAAFAGKANMDSLGLGIFKAMFGSEFNPEIEFSSIKGLLGGSTFNTYVKPFDLNVGANKIVWHGYDLQIKESSNHKNFDLFAHFNGLDYKNSNLDVDVRVHDGIYESACDMQRYEICQGRTKLTLNGFEFNEQGKRISLDKSYINGTSKINDEHLNLAVNLRVNQFDVDKESFNGKLDFDLKHLNAKALQSLNENLDFAKTESLNPETILKQMHDLIKEEVSFGINQFFISTPKGDADLTARMMIKDNRTDTNEPLNFDNLVNELHLDFTVAKPLAEFLMGQWLYSQMMQQQAAQSTKSHSQSLGEVADQVTTSLTPGQMHRLAFSSAGNKTIEQMIKQGFFIEDGEQYKLNVSYQRGASFALNGQDMNLSDFGIDI